MFEGLVAGSAIVAATRDAVEGADTLATGEQAEPKLLARRDQRVLRHARRMAARLSHHRFID
jgi:hypothetical protein